MTQLCLLTTSKNFNLANSELSPHTGSCHGNRVINNHRLMCCVLMKCVCFHICRLSSKYTEFPGLKCVERGNEMSSSHKLFTNMYKIHDKFKKNSDVQSWYIELQVPFYYCDEAKQQNDPANTNILNSNYWPKCFYCSKEFEVWKSLKS